MITRFFLKLTWVTNEDENATGSLLKFVWMNGKSVLRGVVQGHANL